MGLQEIQNERFENSEYWPKQDSEVLKSCKAAFWVLAFYTLVDCISTLFLKTTCSFTPRGKATPWFSNEIQRAKQTDIR